MSSIDIAWEVELGDCEVTYLDDAIRVEENDIVLPARGIVKITNTSKTKKMVDKYMRYLILFFACHCILSLFLLIKHEEFHIRKPTRNRIFEKEGEGIGG